MTSKHLGEKIHDLLDGRLRGAQAAAAMAHLEECAECTARFQELRDARTALNTAEAGIDLTFAQKLLDRERIANIAAHEPSGNARAAAPPDRRPLALAIIIGAAATAVLGTAYMVGAPAQVGLEFVSASGAAQAEPVAYMDPQGMRTGDQLRSWIHPDFANSTLVPVEAKVLQRTDGSNVLVATLLRGMDVVVVTQEHATLIAAASELPRADVIGIDVYVVSSAAPAQVVWQTGDVVIALGCECALATLESVAAEFPTADAPSLVDRVGAGFDELADLLP